MTFRVGQKVVCVDAGSTGKYTPWRHSDDVHGLTEGVVYTIRAVGSFRGLRDNVWLAEIHRPLCAGREYPYAAARFRPVVERKTDISVFTAMLNPSQVTVDAMNTADFARESAG